MSGLAAQAAKPLIVALSGSPSPQSRTAALADHVLRRVASEASDTAHLRLAELDPAALLQAQTRDDGLACAIGLVARAGGVIIATPIFKASFSGLLKVFLDALPQFALAGKVVMPLATGGSPAHVLALDYALRPVLQSMGARYIVQATFVAASQIDLDGDAVALAPDSAALVDEAILHFSHAMRSGAGSPALLGHPRPDRTASSLPTPSN